MDLHQPSRNVLVVDDNAVNQKVAALMLQKLGYGCTLASNGEDAVSAWASASFCAILMDCQMPGMDGFEATVAIRSRERGSHTPIFAMTASDIPDDREKCRQAGMDGYLMKPLNRDEVSRVLSVLVAPSITAPSARTPDDAATPPLDATTVDTLRQLAGMGEPDPFPEIAERFLAQGSARVAKMLAPAPPPGLAVQAHSLRGMSGTIGAKRLARLCGELERRASFGDSNGLTDLVDAVWFEFQCVRYAIELELRKAAPSSCLSHAS